MKKRNILEITDVSKKELLGLVKRALFFSGHPKKSFQTLKGKHVGLLFDSNSLRTKISFEIAVFKMGGHPYFIPVQSVTHENGERRESDEDIIDCLDRFVDLYIVRNYSSELIEVLTRKNAPPFLNAFSGVGHPSQVLADLTVIFKKKGPLKELKIFACCPARGSGVTESFIYGVLILGGSITLITPTGTFKGKNKDFHEVIKKLGGRLFITKDISEVRKADVLYVDEWWENTPNFLQKSRPPKKYRVDKEFLHGTKKDLIIMHCLPAHHDREIAEEVIYSKQSILFDEAEFRLYAAMAWLEFMVSTL